MPTYTTTKKLIKSLIYIMITILTKVKEKVLLVQYLIDSNYNHLHSTLVRKFFCALPLTIKELWLRLSTKLFTNSTLRLIIIDLAFMTLFPPLNFCAVEEDLYRSGMPYESNFQVVVKKIIS